MRRISHGKPTKKLRDPSEEDGFSHALTSLGDSKSLVERERMAWVRAERSEIEENRPPTLQ